MFNLFKKKEQFPNIDWYCDYCNEQLNNQSGFYDGCIDWTCTKCGNVTPINETEIIYNDDFDEDEDDDGESLSVWDAANIYFSNGCDEDYQFGYTHEELVKAFNE